MRADADDLIGIAGLGNGVVDAGIVVVRIIAGGYCIAKAFKLALNPDSGIGNGLGTAAFLIGARRKRGNTAAGRERREKRFIVQNPFTCIGKIRSCSGAAQTGAGIRTKKTGCRQMQMTTAEKYSNIIVCSGMTVNWMKL